MELWLAVCVSDEQRTVPRTAPQRRTLQGGYLSSTVSKHIHSTPSCTPNDSFRVQAPGKFPGVSLEQLWLRTLPAILASVLSGLRNPNLGRIKLCTSTSVPTESSMEKTTQNGGSCGILRPWSPILMGLLTHHRNSNETLACFPTLWNGNLKHFPLN